MCLIEIKKSKVHGVGVFAKNKIKKGEIIEFCPFAIIKGKFKGNLNNYIFDFNSRKSAVVFLHGSLYNHSDSPNVACCFNKKKDLCKFYAIKNIKKGKECFINYGKKYWKADKKEKK